MTKADPFKVDLLAPLGSVDLKLQSGVEAYRAAFGEKEVNLLVRETEPTGPPAPSAPTAMAGARVPKTAAVPPLEQTVPENIENGQHLTGARRHRLAIEAQSYFNGFQLLPWVQNLLQDLIRDRPNDPWEYISNSSNRQRKLSSGFVAVTAPPQEVYKISSEFAPYLNAHFRSIPAPTWATLHARFRAADPTRAARAGERNVATIEATMHDIKGEEELAGQSIEATIQPPLPCDIKSEEKMSGDADTDASGKLAAQSLEIAQQRSHDMAGEQVGEEGGVDAVPMCEESEEAFRKRVRGILLEAANDGSLSTSLKVAAGVSPRQEEGSAEKPCDEGEVSLKERAAMLLAEASDDGSFMEALMKAKTPTHERAKQAASALSESHGEVQNEPDEELEKPAEGMAMLLAKARQTLVEASENGRFEEALLKSPPTVEIQSWSQRLYTYEEKPSVGTWLGRLAPTCAVPEAERAAVASAVTEKVVAALPRAAPGADSVSPPVAVSTRPPWGELPSVGTWHSRLLSPSCRLNAATEPKASEAQEVADGEMTPAAAHDPIEGARRKARDLLKQSVDEGQLESLLMALPCEMPPATSTAAATEQLPWHRLPSVGTWCGCAAPQTPQQAAKTDALEQPHAVAAQEAEVAALEQATDVPAPKDHQAASPKEAEVATPEKHVGQQVPSQAGGYPVSEMPPSQLVSPTDTSGVTIAEMETKIRARNDRFREENEALRSENARLKGLREMKAEGDELRKSNLKLRRQLAELTQNAVGLSPKD